MGDMADFALEGASNDVENYERYKDSSLQTQYENGLIDERGATIGEPWSTPTARKSSSQCSCGGSMVQKQGKYGIFYGCSNFPKCHNSRG